MMCVIHELTYTSKHILLSTCKYFNVLSGASSKFSRILLTNILVIE